MPNSIKRAAPPVAHRILVTRITPTILNLQPGVKAVDPVRARLAGLSAADGNGGVRPVKYPSTPEMISYVARGSFPGLPGRHQFAEPLTMNQELKQFIWCLDTKGCVFRIDSFTTRDSGQMQRADELKFIQVRVDTTSPLGILDVLDQPAGVRIDDHPGMLEDLSTVEEFEVGSVVGGRWYVAAIAGNIVSLEQAATTSQAE